MSARVTATPAGSGAPLVPLFPLVAVRLALQDRAPHYAACLGDVLQRLAEEYISLNHAEREGGFWPGELGAMLCDAGLPVPEQGPHVRRGGVWVLCTMLPGQVDALLGPSLPFRAEHARWCDEAAAAPGASGGTSAPEGLARERQIAIMHLWHTFEELGDARLSLAEATRETGAPPDDVLGYLRRGLLTADGDARAPRVRRGELIALRFQQPLGHLPAVSPR